MNDASDDGGGVSVIVCVESVPLKPNQKCNLIPKLIWHFFTFLIEIGLSRNFLTASYGNGPQEN